jgi:hypothetical protein
MFNIPKVPKQIKKKIRQYHRRPRIWFFVLNGIGFLFLLLAVVITKIAIHLDIISIELIYVIFGMMYIFTFAIPISAFFLIVYSSNIGTTSENFRIKIRLTELIQEMKSNKEEKLVEFQKTCKTYTRFFYSLYWSCFKHYKKRERTAYLAFEKYFVEFDKIITLASVNAEITSKKTTELLNDFSRFLNDAEKKIHIPILERSINRNDVKNFCKKWTKYFKDNYRNKYQESSKTIDEHIQIQREKRRRKHQRNSYIIIGIIATIIGGIILLLIQKLIEYLSL